MCVCVCVYNIYIYIYTGDQLNRQHVPSVDQSELARETERLDREYAASAMT